MSSKPRSVERGIHHSESECNHTLFSARKREILSVKPLHTANHLSCFLATPTEIGGMPTEIGRMRSQERSEETTNLYITGFEERKCKSKKYPGRVPAWM